MASDQQPTVSEEEQHLAQLATAGTKGGTAGDAQAEVARQAVRRDLDQHFVSAGEQMEGKLATAGNGCSYVCLSAC